MIRRATNVLMAAVSVLSVIFFGYRLGAHLLSEQAKISCGPPRHNTTYCVYHRTTPGLLNTDYEILVGRSSGRGLVYKVPYSLEQTSADWDFRTGVVTIAMPGTTLRITPDEYVDPR